MNTPHDLYRQVLKETGDRIAAIRLIRQRFGLDLTQAKEVMIQAEGWAASLNEYQDELADALEDEVYRRDILRRLMLPPTRNRRWPLLVGAFGPVLVVLAGLYCGAHLERFRPPSIAQIAFLAGGLFGLAGLFLGPRSLGWLSVRRLAAASLLAYMLVLAATEPLIYWWGVPEVVGWVLWLLPAIIGGVALPARKCWLAGLGCWSVLFSGTVAMGFNTSHWSGGIGFLVRWIE